MRDANALAARGLKLLLGRQAIIQVLTLGAGVVIARRLAPSEFGVYFIASFFVETAAFAASFGLAPVLIQRREELTTHDLRVAFTLQQIASGVAAVVLFVAAPTIVGLYGDAPHETVWILRAIGLGLLAVGLRTGSMLQLERELRYERVALVEVVETLVFQGTALALALAGAGAWSFAVAAVCRMVLGSVLVFAAAPWPIGFSFDVGAAKRMLRFGLAFQLQMWTTLLGGWVTPVLVGALAGPAAVGLLTWSSSNARKPLLLVENVMRVAFPHVARLQDDRAEVDRILVRYLTLLLAPALLWLTLIVVAARDVVPLLYGERWVSAIGLLTVFAAALVLDTAAWVLGVTLNGIGLVRATTRLTLARTVLWVALSTALVPAVGFRAVPYAYLVSSAAVVPWLARAFGRDTASALVRELRWLAVPLAAGLAAGFAAQTVPLERLASAGLTLAAAAAAFGLATLAVGPAAWRARFAFGGRVVPEGSA